MNNKVEKKNTARNIIIIWLVVCIILWVFCVYVASNTFNSENAVSIYGTMVQGMSALLSVSIAVIIFRIQSLENRLQSLEEFTLDYIFHLAIFTYPMWLPSVEEDIRSGIIVQRYYLKLRRPPTEEKLKEIAENTDPQQKRLMESLNKHVRVEEIIHKTKNGAYPSFFLLIIPIMLSFYMMMISDALTNWFSFFSISIVILFSILGILYLIKTVVDSLVIK